MRCNRRSATAGSFPHGPAHGECSRLQRGRDPRPASLLPIESVWGSPCVVHHRPAWLSGMGRQRPVATVGSCRWPTRPPADVVGRHPPASRAAPPRIAAAQACAGGLVERRLYGAYREYARRRRPAPPAANPSHTLTRSPATHAESADHAGAGLHSDAPRGWLLLIAWRLKEGSAQRSTGTTSTALKTPPPTGAAPRAGRVPEPSDSTYHQAAGPAPAG